MQIVMHDAQDSQMSCASRILISIKKPELQENN